MPLTGDQHTISRLSYIERPRDRVLPVIDEKNGVASPSVADGDGFRRAPRVRASSHGDSARAGDVRGGFGRDGNAGVRLSVRSGGCSEGLGRRRGGGGCLRELSERPKAVLLLLLLLHFGGYWGP